MLLNNFINSIVYATLLLQFSALCMNQGYNSGLEIEMSEITSNQKATLSSLIQQILHDSPQKCTQCKKQMLSSDVSFYLFSFHNCAQFNDENCMICFLQNSHSKIHQSTSHFFDLYYLHDSCYTKLCSEIEKSTCQKCTEKSVSKINKSSKNKSKKTCACCAAVGASFACREAFHELSLSCCGCFFEIIEAFSSSSD